MKVRYLASAALAAVAALAAAPAFAANGGYIDAGFIEEDGLRYQDGFTASGVFSTETSGLNIQIDGNYGKLEQPAPEDQFGSVGVHVGKVVEGGYWGAYVQVGQTLMFDQTNADTLGSVVDTPAANGAAFKATSWEVGLEIENYRENWSWFARANYGSVDNDVVEYNAAGADIGATYYLTDNISLGLDGSMLSIEDSRDLSSVAFTAEWAPAFLPVSAFFRAAWHDSVGSGFAAPFPIPPTYVYPLIPDVSPNRSVTFGVRWAFGAGGSLKERDQSAGNLRKGTALNNNYIR